MSPPTSDRRRVLRPLRATTAPVSYAPSRPSSKPSRCTGAQVCVCREIVHNKYVAQTPEKKGAIFVEQTEEIPESSAVMLSAHGVAPNVHEEAAERKLATIVLTIGLRTGPNPVRSGQGFLRPRNPARTPAVGPQRRMAGGLGSRPHAELDR